MNRQKNTDELNEFTIHDIKDIYLFFLKDEGEIEYSSGGWHFSFKRYYGGFIIFKLRSVINKYGVKSKNTISLL